MYLNHPIPKVYVLLAHYTVRLLSDLNTMNLHSASAGVESHLHHDSESNAFMGHIQREFKIAISTFGGRWLSTGTWYRSTRRYQAFLAQPPHFLGPTVTIQTTLVFTQQSSFFPFSISMEPDSDEISLSSQDFGFGDCLYAGFEWGCVAWKKWGLRAKTRKGKHLHTQNEWWESNNQWLSTNEATYVNTSSPAWSTGGDVENFQWSEMKYFQLTSRNVSRVLSAMIWGKLKGHELKSSCFQIEIAHDIESNCLIEFRCDLQPRMSKFQPKEFPFWRQFGCNCVRWIWWYQELLFD